MTTVKVTLNSKPFFYQSVCRLRQRVVKAFRDEEGSATAEYAIATMAAVGFAGLLVVILRGDEVRGMLAELVSRALTVAG